MSPEEFDALYEKFSDGACSPGEVESLLAALQESPERLRRFWAERDLEQLLGMALRPEADPAAFARSVLRESARKPAPPREFAEDVLRRAGLAREPGPGRPRRPILPLRLAAAAVLLGIVGAALFLLLPGAPPPAPGPTADGQPVVRGGLVAALDKPVRVELGGYCRVRLDPGAALKIEGREKAETIVLERGRVTCEVDRNRGTFAVQTDVGTVTVKGTIFEARLEEPEPWEARGGRKLVVSVIEGAVLLAGPSGEQLVSAGETASASKTAPPAPPVGPHAVQLEQVISREDPLFNCSLAGLRIGQDGLVYVCGSTGDYGVVLRLSRDGTGKTSGQIVYAAANATANRDGIIASANGHFAHKVALYRKDFAPFAEVNDFLVNDTVGFDAAAWVEAGASGDFYGVDPHRDRVVRINPAGKVVTTYTVAAEPAGSGKIQQIRVCEKQSCLYVLPRTGAFRCVGFDGTLRWTAKVDVSGNGYPIPTSGGWDVDPEGNLYVIGPRAEKISRYSPDGKPAGEIPLKMDGELKPQGDGIFFCLAVSGQDVLVKRSHPTELFQCYDLATGALKKVVHADHEKLRVMYEPEIWTAGAPVSFRIDFDAGGRPVAPRWRVWARTYGAMDYRELLFVNGQLSIPPDCAGLYQIKVTPEIDPWQRGTPSEYRIQSVVEIRQADASGSLSVMTPDNRLYYGRGEEIPLTAILRGGSALPPAMTVRLSGKGRVLAEGSAALSADKKQYAFVVPARVTAGLPPGPYEVRASAAGLTAVPQPLTIGPGCPDTFFNMVYGDYGPTYPASGGGVTCDVFDAPDAVAQHLDRVRKYGVNFAVDRLGVSSDSWTRLPNDRATSGMGELAKKLAADPKAVAPEKARQVSTLLQTLAGYSAAGVRQMAILVYNDCGLPLSESAFEGRKPDQLVADIGRLTGILLPYTSFRGWVWSSNWWVFNRRGADAGESPQEKNAYKEALQRAKKSGAWDPVLETVATRRLSYAIDAQKLFGNALSKVTDKLVTSVAAPFRNVEAYPPITFSNVDECDLHIQWEQMGVPYYAPFNVDLYKRPDKRGWGHPEVWNDSGTGDQVLPTVFQMIMRGADGIGCSGWFPNWGTPVEDSRLCYQGWSSIYRSLFGLTRQYGPWLATLKGNDPVAIVGSGRMYKIDEWRNVYGTHFARVWEAYACCLMAHYPAQIVFAEDVQPDTFKKFKAVLVVDQQVELEPSLAAALAAAKAAQVPIFADGTCRPEPVREFTPLGVSFNHFESDRNPAGDDAAYWRFPAYCRISLPGLTRALSKGMPPLAEVDNDEVFLSERVAGNGRYLFAVNNTTPLLEPGQMWRATLCAASRLPVLTSLGIRAGEQPVYDVFALKPVSPQAGKVELDLRTLPMRVFAILPSAIAQVRLAGPASVKAGRAFAWKVLVEDAAGQPINASIPVSVRLADAATVLDEQFSAADPKGAAGVFTVGLNGPPRQRLIATELFSGKSASLELTVEADTQPAAILTGAAPAREEAAASTTEAIGKKPGAAEPTEASFGPHIRDMALTGNGSLALMNAMNWDQNLYAVDPATGGLKWQRRLGQYFAFAPQALNSGFAVQGFELNSAEGYYLYLLSSDGQPLRRFALYGLSRRTPHRFVPGLLNDKMNSFAVPADGEWVASAGDLGLVVWDKDGKVLWSQDHGKVNRGKARYTEADANWWSARLVTPQLTALDSQRLLVVEGLKATAYNARSGQILWQCTIAQTGEITRQVVSSDGRTVALMATTVGGRVFVVREGKTAATFPSGGQDLGLSPDGSLLAVVDKKTVKLFSMARGLQWSFAADDTLRFPRWSIDGKRLAVSSETGTVYVLDPAGRILLEKDMKGVAVPGWLPNGDLMLGSWMGRLCCLDGTYAERWSTVLQPKPADLRGKLLATDSAPTVRMSGWGNNKAQPSPITPNLLAQSPVMIKYIHESREPEGCPDRKYLVDGKPDPPEAPLLDWGLISWLGEGKPLSYLLFDTYRTQLQVTGITLFEDETHPESWLRDAYFERWDPTAEQWVFVQSLLSDAPVHTHLFAKPAESSRFRLVMPAGLVGNLRLGEIVFHGQVLGNAHPDVLAKRPVAVLFDEGDDLKKVLGGDWSFGFEKAYNGGRCIVLKPNGKAYPEFVPPFGHTIPNWDFEIVEKPAPGQYRYAQFAWKAASPETRGITLKLGDAYLVAGAFTPMGDWGGVQKQVAGSPPTDWTVVTADLWDVVKRPFRINQACFLCSGGGAAFDRILLGRTPQDLEAVKPVKAR